MLLDVAPFAKNTTNIKAGDTGATRTLVLTRFTLISGMTQNPQKSLRPPRGVCEAHFHLDGKPYVIATIPSQTYPNTFPLVCDGNALVKQCL